MNGYDFGFSGETLTALPSGALWWPKHDLLVVSDLHLGKSDRLARKTGMLLPPYETEETLSRLDKLILKLNPSMVICLGDTFDDLTAAETLSPTHREWLLQMMEGRRWLWIEGNHDPGASKFGGESYYDYFEKPLTFRHISDPDALAEVSGHYHPKARVAAGISRPCFLFDQKRLILPAFGTYTGGLHTEDESLSKLMSKDALALLTGQQVTPIPMPRQNTK